MPRSPHPLTLVALALLLLPSCRALETKRAIQDQDAGPTSPPRMELTLPAASPTQQYMVLLQPSRPTFDEDQTPAEQEIVTAHFRRLQRMWREGSCLLAGRSVDVPDGYVILRADTPEEALRLAATDPAVESGVFNAEIHPYVAALLHGMKPRVHPAATSPERIEVTTIVQPAPARVFEAWTSSEDVQLFLGISSRIELRPNGPYEFYFLPDTPENAHARGSEGCKILSYAQDRMLTFDWNAPPQFGGLRDVYTRVTLLFTPQADGGTRIDLFHEGFGQGGEWDKVREYFAHAWPGMMRSFEEYCSSHLSQE